MFSLQQIHSQKSLPSGRQPLREEIIHPLQQMLTSQSLTICVKRKIPHTGDKHLLSDADSSTDTIVGWTKNTP